MGWKLNFAGYLSISPKLNLGYYDVIGIKDLCNTSSYGRRAVKIIFAIDFLVSIAALGPDIKIVYGIQEKSNLYCSKYGKKQNCYPGFTSH